MDCGLHCPAMAPKKKAAEALKKKFKEFDANGDGLLDKMELLALLQKGDPTVTRREVDKLWSNIDVNGDGTCGFDEFVDFVTGGMAVSSVRPQKSAAEIKGEDWKDVKGVFDAYAGRDKCLQSSEFMRLCEQANLFGDRKRDDKDAEEKDGDRKKDNHGLQRGEVDAIFAKCADRQHVMKKDGFRNAIQMLADKKGVPAIEIRRNFHAMTPELHATVPEDVSLHYKDKSREARKSVLDGNADKGENPARKEKKRASTTN